MQAANMKYEEARMRLYRLSSIPGSDDAVGRVQLTIDKEIGTLEAKMAWIGLSVTAADISATTLSAAEEKVAATLGCRDLLVAHKARQRTAEAICATIPADQMTLLKVMVGDDREAIASKYVTLKTAGAR